MNMKFVILRIFANLILLFGFYNLYKKFLTQFDQWENSEELEFWKKNNNSLLHNESEYNIYEIMKYNEKVSEILDKLRVRLFFLFLILFLANFIL